MSQTELAYKQTRGFSPFAYTIVNEWLYFCDQYLPCLFRYHLEKKLCEYVAGFHSYYMDFKFFKMAGYKGELWLLPFKGNKIVRFNLKEKKFFDCNVQKNLWGIYIPFYDIYFEGEKAFVIPFGKNTFLVKIDLNTHKMYEIDLAKDEQKSDNINFSGAIRFQNQIYILDCGRNLLVVYDIESGVIETVNSKKINLSDRVPVKGDGNILYFFPLDTNKNIIIYNADKNIFYEKEFPIKTLASDEIYLPAALDGKIWVLANKKAKIYSVDQNMRIKQEISVLNFSVNDQTVYVAGMEFEDRFFWHGHAGSPLIQVKNNTVEIIEINKNILEMYFEMLNKCKYSPAGERMSIGNKIYNKIIME